MINQIIVIKIISAVNASEKLSKPTMSLKYDILVFQSRTVVTSAAVNPINTIGRRNFLKLKISENNPSKPRELNIISVFNSFTIYTMWLLQNVEWSSAIPRWMVRLY
jgi:hypothetical protein